MCIKDMKLLHLLKSGIFLMIILATKDASLIFLRRNDKRLEARPIQTVTVSVPDECLGVCLYNDDCKAFNANDNVCEIFAEDRCLVGNALVDSPGSSYFDAIEDMQCPGNLQKYIYNNVLLT